MVSLRKAGKLEADPNVDCTIKAKDVQQLAESHFPDKSLSECQIELLCMYHDELAQMEYLA